MIPKPLSKIQHLLPNKSVIYIDDDDKVKVSDPKLTLAHHLWVS